MGVLALASVSYADQAPYYGPHQGTVAGSVALTYTDANGGGHSIQEGTAGFAVQEYVTPQAWIKEQIGYTWQSGDDGSANATTYAGEIGYDFLKQANINPYIGIGFIGFSGDNVSSSTNFLGTIGVNDYFAKGRAIFLEEDYFQESISSVNVDIYETMLGIKIDFN